MYYCKHDWTPPLPRLSSYWCAYLFPRVCCCRGCGGGCVGGHHSHLKNFSLSFASSRQASAYCSRPMDSLCSFPPSLLWAFDQLYALSTSAHSFYTVYYVPQPQPGPF
jgi:hypothetical protein